MKWRCWRRVKVLGGAAKGLRYYALWIFKEMTDVIKVLQLNIWLKEFLKKFPRPSEKFLEYSKGGKSPLKGSWLGKRGPLVKHCDKKGPLSY